MIAHMPKSALAQRIRERLDALETNETAAAKKAGLSASAIRNILEGKSKSPRSDTLAAIAESLETTTAYLLGQSSEMRLLIADEVENALHTPTLPNPRFFDERPQNLMRVYASAEGGDGALILSNEPVDYIPRPHVVANVKDAFGVVIEGESMVRAYRPGDVAWINPMLRERRDEDCIFRGFNNQTGEAKALIKVLVSWTQDEWTVEQLNPRKRYKLSRTEWPECYRVVGSTKRP